MNPARPRADALATALLLGLSLVLTLPRLTSPLDLRYDAGVYYILGTALAEGRGYRLLNEPGAIEAIQYPPLLPLIVAAHERVTGTRDPAVTGKALRWTFTALFVVYVLAAFRFGRRWLEPGWALAAALLVLLHLQLLWLSDLLFAELPFACCTMLFLLAAEPGDRNDRRWLAALLAGAAYLLRSAGLAVLVAWIVDAVLRRRWREVLWRAACAALPIFVWQSHVAGVQASPAYREPAYAYQRAAYQFYNVGYRENMSYVDSFAPERGLATRTQLAERALENARALPAALGESLSVGAGWLVGPLARLPVPLPAATPSALLMLLGLVSIAGVALVATRGARLAALYWAGSLVLITATPWAGQFARYLMPLAPLSALGLVAIVAAVWQRTRAWPFRALLAAGLAGILATEIFVLAVAFRTRYVPVAAGHERVFFYDEAWRQHDRAIAWLRQDVGPDAVVATSTPHRVYLQTGLRAVQPPYEADVAEEARLLDGVPIDYLIIDDLDFVDVIRRYAAPVVTAFPERWTLVYGEPDRGSRIYRRAESRSAR